MTHGVAMMQLAVIRGTDCSRIATPHPIPADAALNPILGALGPWTLEKWLEMKGAIFLESHRQDLFQ